MPRKKMMIKKRAPQPDVKYSDVRIAKFINHVMRRGKKSLAEKIVYQALDKIVKETNQPALTIFEKAIKNASPLLEVKSTRVGGATYQVPYEVPIHRQFTLGVRWLIEAARKKQGKPMADFLAEEIIAASNNEGAAVKKKLDTHKMAEANRAFVHYARF